MARNPLLDAFDPVPAPRARRPARPAKNPKKSRAAGKKSKKAPGLIPALPGWTARFLAGLKIDLKAETVAEIGAVFWATLGILATLALAGALGPAGEVAARGLRGLAGAGAWLLPIFFFATAGLRFREKTVKVDASRQIGATVLLLAMLGFFHLPLDPASGEPLAEAAAGRFGGYLGFGVTILPQIWLGAAGTAVILTAGILIGILLVFDVPLAVALDPRRWAIFEKDPGDARVVGRARIGSPDDEPEEIFARIQSGAPAPEKFSQTRKRALPVPAEILETEIPDEKNLGEKSSFAIARPLAVRAKTAPTDLKIPTPAFQKDAEFELPPVDLLDPADDAVTVDDAWLRESAEMIADKLARFGIEVEVTGANVGPTVIRYSLRPAAGVKLSKIKALRDDLALALAAKSLRIEAPIPGQNLVGIEIPNRDRVTVKLREILESGEFGGLRTNLRLVVGQDVAGAPVVADLKKMPHLLVAGQTGSGKSVCVNAFLVSLLYQNSPNDLKLLLVDPKRVELARYNGIPHLLTPVITEPTKAVAALKWTVAEMTRRLKLFEEARVPNLDEFNEKKPDEKLPNIVVILDELADLMMTAKNDVEALVCRLAQMARAAGIHLVVATQRPSVDVITGLIKANIPSRLAFTVASGTDSRTILDAVGAENLLGAGDSLFLPSGAMEPVRVQSAFLSTREIDKVIARVKLAETDAIPMDVLPSVDEILDEDRAVEIPGFRGGAPNFGGDDGGEERLGEVLDLIRETGKASASLLQRRLGMGYARAARALDILEQKNILAPADGAKPREIFWENVPGGEDPDRPPEN